ncbi:putative ribonuclease H-like domain-containing protein [Tanacetum coccineum]
MGKLFFQESLREDSNGKPLYSRFTKTNDFKGVPHPLSGDYTPKPQEEIDGYSFEDSWGEITSEHSFETESESLSVQNEMSTSKLVDHLLKNMVDRGIFDSGCSGHMTEVEGILTFSYIHNIDKQNKVLFTETECLVVSSDFKMSDKNQILLKVLRHHNMYSFDMKTPTPVKDEDVYVSLPPGFVDHESFTKVYKVVKALYGLHQAPRAWYATLSQSRGSMETRGEQVTDLFNKRTKKDIMLVQVQRIFKYLKGKPNLGLWYPRESPFDLEAFSNSDYGWSNLDRKSITSGCHFLGQRLISWQFPQLISKNDSLETDLKQTKLTMGNAIVKLVKKVKKLEGLLKRRDVVLSDSEEEEPEAQGRKTTKASLKRFGEELQAKTSKRLKSDEAKDDEPTKKSGKRRKHMARKGLHTNLDKDDSEGSDEVSKKLDDYVTVREDGTNIVYINFGAMLKDISRDDLTELYRIVMNRYGMDGPEDELERVFWKYLKNMLKNFSAKGLTSPEQTATVEMVFSQPWTCTFLVAKGLTTPELMANSKPSLAVVVGCKIPFMVEVCFVCPSMDCLWHKYHYCPHCNAMLVEFEKND